VIAALTSTATKNPFAHLQILVGTTNPSPTSSSRPKARLWLVVIDASDAITVDVGDSWGAVGAGGSGGGGDADESVVMLDYSVFSIHAYVLLSAAYTELYKHFL